MIEHVFILRSRIGRAVFVVRGDTLEITEYFFGRRRDSQIALRAISPEYELHGQRVLGLVTVLLVPVALGAAIYRWLLHRPDVPDLFLQYPLYLAAVFAFAAFRLYPRFEVFTFKNHFGRPLFTILRERGQTAECEAFVHALLDRLEAIDAADATGESPRPAPSAIDEEPVAERRGGRWLLAVVLSAVALLEPPIVHTWAPQHDAFTSVGIVIAASGGAVVAALASFAQREPRKWIAAAAALAALIPVFFY